MRTTTHHSVHATIVTIVLLFAGCMSESATNKEDLGPDQGDPIGELGNVVEFELEGCAVYYHLTTILQAWAEPYMPEGFEFRSPVPGQNFAHLKLFSCDRAIFNDTVVEEFRVFKLAVEASAHFPEREDIATLLFLDSYTNSETYQRLIHDFGTDINLAEITHEETLDSTSKLTWDIQGDGFRFELDLPQGEPSQTRGNSNMVNWYAGPPHTRLQITGTEDSMPGTESDIVTLIMEGDTVFRNVLGGNDRGVLRVWNTFDSPYTMTLEGGHLP